MSMQCGDTELLASQKLAVDVLGDHFFHLGRHAGTAAPACRSGDQQICDRPSPIPELGHQHVHTPGRGPQLLCCIHDHCGADRGSIRWFAEHCEPRTEETTSEPHSLMPISYAA